MLQNIYQVPNLKKLHYRFYKKIRKIRENFEDNNNENNLREISSAAI